MWTKEKVARCLDHAAIRPEMTDSDIVRECAIAKKHGICSVIVRPTDVALARKELKGSGVKVGVTIGFPHGAHTPQVKALEAELAVKDGADEMDMMINLGKFLSGDYSAVRRDIEGVVAVAKKRGVLVKVILETCYMSPEQIRKASEIVRDAGGSFVKTTTGFGAGPATPEAIKIMVEAVGKSIGVKASGGIKNWETAVSYLELGCTRLGVTSTEAILSGGES